MPTAQDAPANKLVVVIDDDPIILDAMAGLLRSWGYQVVTAASDEAALARLASHDQRPDLIISDYHLADGKTGVQAIERLRGAFEIPAVLITGGSLPARRQRGRPTGYQLMRKPVEPTALQAMLSQLITRQDSRGED
jgi:CheY-like chemotaxis protein